jgi:superfamily II DNA helicase RecQ
VIPFLKLIDPEYNDGGYMFPNLKSKYGHWDTGRQTKILVRETRMRLGFEMRTSDWRQIQVALDREFIRTGMEDLIDPDEDDYEDDIHDLQAVHSTRTAKTTYGVTGVMDTTTSGRYRQLSGKFHKFYHVLSRPARSDFSSSVKVTTMTVPSESKIQDALDNLHGMGSKFRSLEQRQALNTILQGHSPVVVILPTAGGKTDLILIPAMLSPEKTFVVLTPYIALADDLEERCNNSGLSCHRWTKKVTGRANIVVIVMDAAVGPDCIQFLRNIYLNGFFGSLYIDEMHTIAEDGHYRPILPEVIPRLSLPVQHIGLTATFPPSCKDRYEEAMCWTNLNPVYIRATTRKSRMKYSVRTVDDGTVREEVVKLVNLKREEFEKDGRQIMVFCRSKKDCDDLSRTFGCPKYYSNWQDKESDLQMFKQGIARVIVCTGALGAGMDFDDVALVVHVDKAYGCLAFGQELGRAGRNGEDADSIMFIDYSLKAKLKDSGAMTGSEKAMAEYILETRCRRIPLNRYLDGDSSELRCEELDCRLCDLCEAGCSSVAAPANNINGSQKRALGMEEGTVISQPTYRKHCDAGSQRAMDSEQFQTYMVSVVKEFQAPNLCVFCYFFTPLDCYKHCAEDCRFQPLLWDPDKVGGVRWQLNFEDNRACYRCGVPCNWCPDYLAGKCEREVNVVKEVCGFAQTIAGQAVDRLARRSFSWEKQYIEWLQKSCDVEGENSTNAFAVFREVCKARRR